MTQRQVDVMDKSGSVLHTYPITLGAETAPKASDFEKAALKEAGKAKLVPDGDIAHLTARMHPHVAASHQAATQPQAATAGTAAKN